MRPSGSPSMPHIGNHLPGLHLLPHCNADTGAMGIQGRESSSVVDFDIVPITATPTVSGVGNSHGAICCRKDWCTFRDCDISTAVVADLTCNRVSAIPLRRGYRTRNR